MTDGDVIGRGRTAEVFALSETRVIKLFNPGITRDRVEGEYERSLMAANAGLLTPMTFGLETIDDRLGILFDRIDGPTMLDELGRKPLTMAAVAKTLAQLGSDVGDHDAPALRPLREFVRARLLRADLDDDARAKLLRRLDELPGGVSLCHFDLHPGNVIVSARGPIIIDWANACAGDHAADVAQTVLILSCGAMPPDAKRQWLIRNGRRMFCRLVRHNAITRDPTLADRISRWMPVLAGARLAEQNEGERDRLLEIAAGIS